MSRRTQLTTKFTFSLLAQLSENFIFIYLGLSLFTEVTLEYKPLLILVTVVGICVARWCAVFPLSNAINWVIRYRAQRRGLEVAEELPMNWKIMIYWAGLRGAVGVALAAGLDGPSGYALKATVLVVVVLTVIIFGGTTARMLEILHIRTGVVEEIDSDDEFDIEPIRPSGYGRTSSGGFGANGGLGLDHINPGRGKKANGKLPRSNSWGSGSFRPDASPGSRSRSKDASVAERGLLDPDDFTEGFDATDEDVLDLPPAATGRTPQRVSSAALDSSGIAGDSSASRNDATWREWNPANFNARGALNQIIQASEDPGTVFRRLDEQFLKPHLLLDPHSGQGTSRHGSGQGGSGSPSGH